MTQNLQLPTAPVPLEPASPIRQVGVQVGHLWWVPLVAGLLSVGLGLAVLATDWTIHALVVMTGILLVIRGIALAFHPSYAGDGAGEQVAAGALGIIVGVVLIAWPGPTLLVLAVVFGIWLALSGAFQVVTCVARRRHMPQWWLGALTGTVELLLGVWVMRRPEVTVSLVITVIGLWMVITGVIYCVQAFELRNTLHDEAQALP
jgi:uncharacterized membrane protein HdeD (DUF308 family)